MSGPGRGGRRGAAVASRGLAPARALRALERIRGAFGAEIEPVKLASVFRSGVLTKSGSAMPLAGSLNVLMVLPVMWMFDGATDPTVLLRNAGVKVGGSAKPFRARKPRPSSTA